MLGKGESSGFAPGSITGSLAEPFDESAERGSESSDEIIPYSFLGGVLRKYVCTRVDTFIVDL
jgi:hypothetical protein